MAQFKRKTSVALQLLRSGHLEQLVRRTTTRIHGSSEAVGMRRDLTRPHPSPVARLAFTIAPVAPAKVAVFERSAENAEEAYEQASRARLLTDGPGHCYGAFTEEGDLAYVQWLIRPAHNDLLGEYYEGAFPPLAPEEVLLEAAYTFPQFRGFRLMSAAMAHIAEIGRTDGARTAWTYVQAANFASIKGCRTAGFVPALTREERFRMFRSHFDFRPLDGAAADAAVAVTAIPSAEAS